MADAAKAQFKLEKMARYERRLKSVKSAAERRRCLFHIAKHRNQAHEFSR